MNSLYEVFVHEELLKEKSRELNKVSLNYFAFDDVSHSTFTLSETFKKLQSLFSKNQVCCTV